MFIKKLHDFFSQFRDVSRGDWATEPSTVVYVDAMGGVGIGNGKGSSLGMVEPDHGLIGRLDVRIFFEPRLETFGQQMLEGFDGFKQPRFGSRLCLKPCLNKECI